MRIGIVKPDYKITGGFEIVVDKIVYYLQQIGYDVDIIKVDMTDKLLENDMFKISADVYEQNAEFFRYAFAVSKFEALDLSEFDVVISTQPPSFAIKHKRHISLFYHHMKIYYDLYDLIKEVKLFDDKIVYELSMKTVRLIDSQFLNNNIKYLAGSKHIVNRLATFNKVTNVEVMYAGIDDQFYNYSGKRHFHSPICVGRHEFPKRPELFVHAMYHVDKVKGKIIGNGGRTQTIKQVDKYLSYIHSQGLDIDDNKLWKELLFKIGDCKYSTDKSSNVDFLGAIDKEKLIKEYANSLCVVCPAYEEDYGLTAIEAMSFGKPVIACNDGGGYKELIINGETGFVVNANANEIAQKINFLKDNPKELERLSKNAYEHSRIFSWGQAINTIDNCIKSL